MDKAGVSTRKSDSKEWKIYRKVEEKKKGKSLDREATFT